MARGSFRLKAIALVAAYAVALQGLLVAFVPFAAFAEAGILCSGNAAASGVPDGSTDHEPSCKSACAMLAGAAMPAAPDVLDAVPQVGQPDAPCLAAAPSVAAPRGPQAARAPPFA